MVQTQKANAVQWATLVIAAVFLISGFIMMNATEEVTYPTAEEIAALVIIPESEVIDLSKLDEVYAETFKEDTTEDIAENLALDEMFTKDFRKELARHLNRIDNIDVDYKDIIEYDIRDLDVDLDGEDATVEVEFKVYFENYGDSDEVEKARYIVTFEIEDLDEDEDYEDASVIGFGEWEFIKFYD